jgi:mono/diheme cytochrome c family protein
MGRARRVSSFVAALAGFLASLMAAGPATAANGAEVYTANCAACHQPDGAGIPGLAPPLRSELWKRLGKRSPEYIAGVLISGMVGLPLDGQRYGAAMPPWAHMSDAELAAVSNFVLQKLNGTKPAVAEAVVKEARKTSPDAHALKQLREGGG